MKREKKNLEEKTRQLVKSLAALESVAHLVDRVFQRAPEIPQRWAQLSPVIFWYSRDERV
jgi:hypothetical protein